MRRALLTETLTNLRLILFQKCIPLEQTQLLLKHECNLTAVSPFHKRHGGKDDKSDSYAVLVLQSQEES